MSDFLKKISGLTVTSYLHNIVFKLCMFTCRCNECITNATSFPATTFSKLSQLLGLKAAALLWNTLPANFRDTNGIAGFQRGLKTLLFRQDYEHALQDHLVFFNLSV